MVERIGPSSPSSPSERKKVPNSDRFKKEIQKVEKPGEAELDQPKSKKRFFMLQEEEDAPPKEAPSPYESSFYTTRREEPKEDLPRSPAFYRETETRKGPPSFEKTSEEEKEPSFVKKEGKEKEKTILAPEEKKEKELLSPLALPKETLGKEKKPLLFKEEAEKRLAAMPFKEKKEFEKAPPVMKKPEKKEALFPFPKEKEERKIEKTPLFATKEKKGPTEEKKEPISFPTKKAFVPLEEKVGKKEKEKIKAVESKGEAPTQIKEGMPTIQELPPAVMTEASATASAVAPYVQPESLPLFERMVGTIIQMRTQHIETCEVLLTAAAFVGSKYYGTKIIFEKYATAPDSFNIHLIGSDEAVVLFNEHLEGLMQAFQSAHLPIKIGRLWAEHETERPLFKRKPSVSEEKEKR